MESSEIFALLSLVIQISFGVIFLFLFRAGVAAAGRWGGAYIFNAAAILSYVLPIDALAQTLLADLFFLASFYCFGEALLVRYGSPLLVPQRLALVAVVLVLDVYVVFVLESLSLNLLLIDMAIVTLLTIAHVAVWRHMLRGIDLALGLLSGLSIVNNLVMALVFGLFMPTGHQLSEFLVSDYSYVMQIAGGIFAIWFGIAALAAAGLDALAQYRKAADHDPLSGLLNRRGFDAAIKPLLVQGDRGALLNVDIDHFKKVNDDFGHDAGDLVLTGMADLLRSVLPQNAIISRFGGEEFVIVLPELSMAEGGAIAHSIRLASMAHNWRSVGVVRPITLCVGVSEIMTGEHSWRQAFNRADAALYAAKEDGRNQVMFGTADAYSPISRTAA